MAVTTEYGKRLIAFGARSLSLLRTEMAASTVRGFVATVEDITREI